MTRPLKFGVFITPFHPVGQSPTLALEYDMERVVALDRLGFDEAWFGEHHSGGYELIACPEVFIAAAAETLVSRTSTPCNSATDATMMIPNSRLRSTVDPRIDAVAGTGTALRFSHQALAL